MASYFPIPPAAGCATEFSGAAHEIYKDYHSFLGEILVLSKYFLANYETKDMLVLNLLPVDR